MTKCAGPHNKGFQQNLVSRKTVSFFCNTQIYIHFPITFSREDLSQILLADWLVYNGIINHSMVENYQKILEIVYQSGATWDLDKHFNLEQNNTM